MSRTFKDAPSVRKARRDRRFAERPFPYVPAAVPVDPWDALAEADTLGVGGRIRASAEQRILELLADPETSGDPDTALDPPYITDADAAGMLAAAELTSIANGF
jgi:hypothetical protein